MISVTGPVGETELTLALAARVANAAMEIFFSSLKAGRTGRKTYSTRNHEKADVFDYIKRFYNPTRRHSTLGYLSPWTSRGGRR